MATGSITTNTTQSAKPVSDGGPFRALLETAFFAALAAWPLHLGGVHLWSFSAPAFLLSFAFLVRRFLGGPGETPLSLRRTDLEGPLVVFLALFLAAVFNSRLPWRSAIEAYRAGVYLCVFWAALAVCRNRTAVRKTAVITALIGTALSFIGLLQYSGGLPRGFWHKPEFLSSVYVNHNHFAGFLEMALPVSLGLVIAERDRAKKTLLVFLSAVMGFAFLLTLSRAGFAALAAGVGVMLAVLAYAKVLRGAAWVFLSLALIAGTAVLLVGVGPIVERLKTIETIALEDESANRLGIWRGALSLIAARPWIGTGPGTFEFAFLAARPAGYLQRPGFVHNDYLELAADAGLPALLAALVLFGALALKGVRVAGRDTSRLRIGIGAGCLGGIAAIGVHGLFDFNLRIPANAVFFAMLSALLLSLDGIRFYKPGLLSRLGGFFVTLTAALVCAASVFYGAADFFRWRGERALARADTGAASRFLDLSKRLNPLDPEARYLAGMTTARDGAACAADPACAAKAAGEFGEALRLNPYEPYYHLNRAIYLSRTGTQPAEWAPFRAALERDPNDPKLSYLAAKEVLALNTARDPVIEEEAHRALRNALEKAPSYLVQVYGVLWNYHKDPEKLAAFAAGAPLGPEGFVKFLEEADLWRFHRPYFLKIRGFDAARLEREAASFFWLSKERAPFDIETFVSPPGREIRSGKLLYRRGEISTPVSLAGNRYRLVLSARSTAVRGTWGYLVIKLDGKAVDSVYVDSAAFKEYAAVWNTAPGPHTLTIEFANDRRVPGGDRNVWIETLYLQNYGKSK